MLTSHRAQVCLACLLFLGALPLGVRAQSNANWSEWETLKPDGEEFTILMPKNSTSETTSVQYHKMELTSRLYVAAASTGPVVAVVSMSGIKSNPALYSEFERFNSYVDAFKNWFPVKVIGKNAVGKLTLLGNKTFHGYSGREYRMTIGNLDGVAQSYVTRKRFYAVLVLNSKKDDSLQERFLASFVLPDRPPDPPPAVAQNNEAQKPAEVTGRQPAKPGDPRNPEGETESGGQPKPPDAKPTDTGETPPPPAKHAPISGGILNGKAIYLPLPEVPPGGVSGIVAVQITIDEQGSVVEARAVSGPQQLQAAAVNAARLAIFSPTRLMGEPVRVTGVLTYSFSH